MAIVEEENRKEACAIYTADCIAAITTRLFRMSGADSFEVPLFSDRLKPPEPAETASQVKERILEKLKQ